MSNRNLYFDASVLQHPDYRGVHVYALSLLTEMSTLAPNVNFHLHFGMKGWNKSLADLVAKPNVKVYKFGGPIGRHLMPPLNIARTGSSAYCILNGNTGRLRIPVPCPTAAVFHDMRLILYPDLYGQQRVNRFASEAELWIRRLDLIITGSHTVKREIIDYFGIDSDRVVVVCEGCDHRSKDGAGEMPTGFSGDWRYFLTVNPSDIRKNLRFVLDAFSLYVAQEKGSSTKLVIAGYIEDIVYFRRWCFENPEAASRTVALGYLCDESLVYLYRNAIASVYVSLYEGFGIPIIESYQLNCPAILSDIPVFREVADAAGIYVQSGNIQQLFNAMVKVECDQEFRSKKIEQGALRALFYQWQPSARIALEALLGL